MSNEHSVVPGLAATVGEYTALSVMALTLGAASAVTVGSATYLLVGMLTGGREFLRAVPTELGFLLARRPTDHVVGTLPADPDGAVADQPDGAVADRPVVAWAVAG